MSKQHKFLAKHTFTSGLVLDLSGASGSVMAQEGSNMSKPLLAVAHGVLMLTAFAVLMPAGALMARHKYLFTHMHTHTKLQVRAVCGTLEIAVRCAQHVYATYDTTDQACVLCSRLHRTYMTPAVHIQQ